MVWLHFWNLDTLISRSLFRAITAHALTRLGSKTARDIIYLAPKFRSSSTYQGLLKCIILLSKNKTFKDFAQACPGIYINIPFGSDGRYEHNAHQGNRLWPHKAGAIL